MTPSLYKTRNQEETSEFLPGKVGTEVVHHPISGLESEFGLGDNDQSLWIITLFSVMIIMASSCRLGGR